MKTRFTWNNMNIRIACDECQKDKFTKNEIIEALTNGNATMDGEFILLTTQTNKIMGVVESTEDMLKGLMADAENFLSNHDMIDHRIDRAEDYTDCVSNADMRYVSNAMVDFYLSQNK